MPRIRTKPSEFLVVAEAGKLLNRGAAASLFLWPRTGYVKVPGDQQEARFEMTQETRDGIPLRFKGIVILRIVRPEVTAQLFDFTSPDGLETLKSLVSSACLGELRDRVSHMTMQQCIEERKTTLTGAVQTALKALIDGESGSWGVTLDVVQVAQVFIVDQDLRRQLEAETRNQIKSSSDRAELSARESVQVARIGSERRVHAESLETEKQQIALDREKHALEVDAEQARVEMDKPLQLLRFRNRLEILEAKKRALELEKQVEALRVEKDLLLKRAEHELRKQILPLEQAPQIAESVSHVFHGARLSVYGNDSHLMGTLEPLVDMLTEALRGAAGAQRSSSQ
ncbi:MAG TPA: SPFH domain-containing protein [Spirochaetia bacterium]|nr:SPFH domain-containing protein [Spirochaetia bacterium]